MNPPSATDPRIAELVDFWRDAGPQRWFAKDEQFDRDFHERYLALHYAAARRELEHWLDSPKGGLALLLLLDQFPRNAFRGTAHMFATDPLARHYADRMLQAGQDQAVETELRLFCYLPFMHAEDLADQTRCGALCEALGTSQSYAEEHRDIIARYGRFPHRNPVLARETTPEEAAFLEAGGFSG